MIELINFYKFFPIQFPESFGQELYLQARCLGLRGTLIIAAEGCNLALCGSPYGIERFLKYLEKKIATMPLWIVHKGERREQSRVVEGSEVIKGSEIIEKSDAIINRAHLRRSKVDEWPHRRLSLKLRSEIVTNRFVNMLSTDGAVATASAIKSNKITHNDLTRNDLTRLSPQQFHERASHSDTLLVDMRNYYEWAIGSFHSALRLPMRRFSELPLMLPLLLPYREREILTFCTGGIRCEKAVSFLQNHDFPRVRQLEGGILHYLENFADGLWEGECFVFDRRISIDKKLRRGSFQFCNSCGQAAQKGLCMACAPSF